MASSFFFSLGRSTSYSSVPKDEDEHDGLQLQRTPQHDIYNDNSQIDIEDHPEAFTIDDEDEEEYDVVDLEEHQQSPSSRCSSRISAIIPSNYICPLTLQVMHEPVSDGCGHCFERDAITSWIEHHEICPISRKPLHFRQLQSADALSLRIQEWRQEPHHRDLETAKTEIESSSLSSSSIVTSGGGGDSIILTSPPPMIIESLLLPQELEVLQMIKGKARDRQTRHEFNNCIWSLLLTVAICLFIAMCFAMKYLQLEIRGPL